MDNVDAPPTSAADVQVRLVALAYICKASTTTVPFSAAPRVRWIRLMVFVGFSGFAPASRCVDELLPHGNNGVGRLGLRYVRLRGGRTNPRRFSVASTRSRVTRQSR